MILNYKKIVNLIILGLTINLKINKLKREKGEQNL